VPSTPSKVLRRYPAAISTDHPDFVLLNTIKSAIVKRAGDENKLRGALPQLLQDALDFVIDPVRTARNSVAELDNVEKTFIGLKVEHFLRDFLDVPSGLRDISIDGIDIDVKNTVGATWTIPPETYRNAEPCILIAIADAEKKFWLGLIVAKPDYLTNVGNRDGKKSVSAAGLRNILWIVEKEPLPESKWQQIDLVRFRALRKIEGGAKRATAFFKENLNRPIHRTIVETLLFDQRDYMKRVRANGGARDLLQLEGIRLLSTTFDKAAISKRGYDIDGQDFWIAVKEQ
jgi:hypothetical protein